MQQTCMNIGPNAGVKYFAISFDNVGHLSYVVGMKEQNMNESKDNMKTITLKNSFHQTSVSVRVPYEVAGSGMEYGWLERERPATARRVKRTLCGMSDCKCGIIR
jgi:hypothetical protein